jgi:hypothetical protein
MAKKDEAIQVKVRMQSSLHRRLQREAYRHGQTLNAEILTRLVTSFEPIENTIEKLFATQEKRLGRIVAHYSWHRINPDVDAMRSGQEEMPEAEQKHEGQNHD